MYLIGVTEYGAPATAPATSTGAAGPGAPRSRSTCAASAARRTSSSRSPPRSRRASSATRTRGRRTRRRLTHAAQPAAAGTSTGSVARSTVPSPGGLVMVSVPLLTSTRSDRPVRPVPPAGSAPPDPSSRTSIDELLPGDCQAHARAARGGVLDDVGQRLGDDEVRGRLDLGGEPLGRDVEVDGDGGVGDERLKPGTEPAAGERGRKDAAHEVAELVRRALGVVERLVDQRGDRIGAGRRALRELEGDEGAHQPLLCTVMDVALDAAPRLVRRGEDPRAGGDQLPLVLGVGDGGGGQLRELRQAILRAGRRREVRRAGGDRAPDASFDDDRDGDARPAPRAPSRSPRAPCPRSCRRGPGDRSGAAAPWPCRRATAPGARAAPGCCRRPRWWRSRRGRSAAGPRRGRRAAWRPRPPPRRTPPPAARRRPPVPPRAAGPSARGPPAGPAHAPGRCRSRRRRARELLKTLLAHRRELPLPGGRAEDAPEPVLDDDRDADARADAVVVARVRRPRPRAVVVEPRRPAGPQDLGDDALVVGSDLDVVPGGAGPSRLATTVYVRPSSMRSSVVASSSISLDASTATASNSRCGATPRATSSATRRRAGLLVGQLAQRAACLRA